jgi:competence protein ComFC
MLSQLVNRIEWFRAIADFAFPPLCLGCGVFCEEDSGICSDCLKRIEVFEYPTCLSCEQPIEQDDGCDLCGGQSFPLFAFAYYVSPLKEIIFRFKFGGITTPARFFANMIEERFSDRIRSLDADLLVPVPLHPSREYSRGYNQAALLAQSLQGRLEIPCETDRVVRTKKRKPQTRLRKPYREKNIEGVFKVIVEPGENRKVILVDDIVTTGATVREVRRVLVEAGYEVAGTIAAGHGI